MPKIKNGVLHSFLSDNTVPFSPPDKSQSQGNGEEKLANDLILRGHHVMKNPGGENAFPDLICSNTQEAFGEVKCVTRKHPRLNFGRHSEWARSVRRCVYEDMMSSNIIPGFDEVSKICGGYLGQTVFKHHLEDSVWLELQHQFFSEYFKKANNRLFLLSEDGWICLGIDAWEKRDLMISAITASAVWVMPSQHVRPFAK